MTHPNEIATGTTLELKVISYGKSVGQAEIKVFDSSSDGHDPVASIQCDDQGIGKFQIDTPGRYLFSCQLEREVKDDPKMDIHSFNVYLTVSVKRNLNPAQSPDVGAGP
jgi:hypothetical protein